MSFQGKKPRIGSKAKPTTNSQQFWNENIPLGKQFFLTKNIPISYFTKPLFLSLFANEFY